MKVAQMMFRDLWDHRLAQGAAQAKAINQQIAKLQKQIDNLLDRIAELSVASVMGAMEKRIEKLEGEKIALQERASETARPKTSYERTLRTALAFLANPWNLWASGDLHHRKTVLKLAFSQRLKYQRERGFRTAEIALPFKMLATISGDKKEMARPKRFELLTPRFVVWCSIQLSYGRAGRRCGGSGGRRARRPEAAQPIHG